jgi:hypothetical protein
VKPPTRAVTPVDGMTVLRKLCTNVDVASSCGEVAGYAITSATVSLFIGATPANAIPGV